MNDDYLNVICGVSQGSTLEPLLFNFYINDIFQLQLRGKIQLFADDAVIKNSSTSLEEMATDMRVDLVVLNEWFKYNPMPIMRRLSSPKSSFSAAAQ